MRLRTYSSTFWGRRFSARRQRLRRPAARIVGPVAICAAGELGSRKNSAAALVHGEMVWTCSRVPRPDQPLFILIFDFNDNRL